MTTSISIRRPNNVETRTMEIPRLVCSISVESGFGIAAGVPQLNCIGGADRCRTSCLSGMMRRQRNRIDHKGVSFEDAATVFEDPSAVEQDDETNSASELRKTLIGYCSRLGLLRVTFTERPPRLRIISARRADGRDSRFYDNGY